MPCKSIGPCLVGLAIVFAGGSALAAQQGASTPQREHVETSRPQGTSSTSGQSNSATATGQHEQTQQKSKATSTTGTQGQVKDVKNETKFLQEVHQINQGEIKVGELAKSNAQSQAAKDFAQTLVNDHEQSDRKAGALANQLGVDLAAAKEGHDVRKIQDKNQKIYDKLKGASTDKFDKTFAKEMKSAHKDALDAVKRSSRDLKDPQVKAFAADVSSMLRNHESAAANLEKSEKVAH